MASFNYDMKNANSQRDAVGSNSFHEPVKAPYFLYWGSISFDEPVKAPYFLGAGRLYELFMIERKPVHERAAGVSNSSSRTREGTPTFSVLVVCMRPSSRTVKRGDWLM